MLLDVYVKSLHKGRQDPYEFCQILKKSSEFSRVQNNEILANLYSFDASTLQPAYTIYIGLAYTYV